MADDSYGRWPFRPVSNGQWWTFETSDVTWSQMSTLIYILNPELMYRSVLTDVLICQSQFTRDLHLY